LKTWVLDAGVAAKWYLAGEPLADEAIGMLQQFQTGDIEFLVPDLAGIWKCFVEGGRTSAHQFCRRGASHRESGGGHPGHRALAAAARQRLRLSARQKRL
jgi:hypothetical protein